MKNKIIYSFVIQWSLKFFNHNTCALRFPKTHRRQLEPAIVFPLDAEADKRIRREWMSHH